MVKHLFPFFVLLVLSGIPLLWMLFRVPPTSFLIVTLFLLLLFLFSFGGWMSALLILSHRRLEKPKIAYKQSLRRSFLLTFLIVGILFLQSIRLTTFINVTLLSLFVISIELLSFTAKRK